VHKWMNPVRCCLWGLTHVGPRNHIFNGGQDRTNAFAAVRGDKSAMRPFATLLWTLVLSDDCNCGADAERRKLKLQQSEKDAQAVSRMRKMRVTWTSEEDSLVSTILSLYCMILSDSCMLSVLFYYFFSLPDYLFIVSQ